jgi:4'-phosphopantetheinyl transferase
MITPDDIHLWWARTDSPEWDLNSMASLLSDDEQSRANRFHFPHHRRRFIVSHGMLRSILGYYLKKPPSSLKFANDAKGKPHLEDAEAGSGLCFSLSHSHDMALCAIALDLQIGVDIEHIRPLSNVASIAKRYFLESELISILDSPPNDRDRIFFHYWTIKEACLKASGEGLTGLRKIQITPHARNQEAYSCSCKDSKKIWTIRSIHLHTQYSAAVAVEGKYMRHPILRQFPEDFYLNPSNKDL